MRRGGLLLAALTALTFDPAYGAGIDLAWNDCSRAGAAVEQFACDTNLGKHTLVASVRPPAGITRFISAECTFQFFANASAMPTWWQLRNQTNQLNQCRNGALTASANFTQGPSTCVDPFGGLGAGGIAAYSIAPPPSYSALLRVVFSLPSASARALAADSEYYACRVTIDNRNTVGPGACGECGTGIVIMLTEVRLVQEYGTPGGNIAVWNWDYQGYVGWQCDVWCGTDGPCIFSCPTPANSRTWGAIKSLYR
jgi:hypothetical protein